MLVVVSPAKRLTWSESPARAVTTPEFAQDAAHLARRAARLSKTDLRKLMGISENLASLNQKRFRAFSEAPAPEDVRPALDTFAGDTYQGIDAASLDADARAYAQEHLAILSGLYGLLRPDDGIQPYRLEMGSKLSTRKAADLYGYWGDRIARALAARAAETGSDAVVNCASQEYFGAVDTEALGLRVITPVFLEDRPDGPKIVSFYAKKARGAMARFVMERRLRDPDALAEFDTGGYAFDPARSAPDAPVFLRRAADDAAA
jgi:hypothetical protein